jgi:hypothetical protein
VSFDLTVHFPTVRKPSPQQWQAAIAERGFPLKLDTDRDITALTGSLPCEYQGKAGVFEASYSVLSPDDLRYLELPESSPSQVFFSTRAPKEEFLSAVIAAAVLAEMTGGLLVDPQEGKTHEDAEAIAWARELERTYENPTAVLRAGNHGTRSPKPWWKFW